MIHVHYEDDLKSSGKERVDLVPLRGHLHTGSQSSLPSSQYACSIEVGMSSLDGVTPRFGLHIFSCARAYCE